MVEGNRTSSGNYRQQWAAYNAAQTNEKRHFTEFLYNLVQGVEEPEQILGRPRMSLGDMIFCAVLKSYENFSSRRFNTDLQEAKAQGWIKDVPHFNTIFKYLKEEWLTPYLQELVIESSLPLKAVENYFAVDSTGLRTYERRQYYNRHKNKTARKRVYLKLHAVTGVKTNVITYAVVSEGNASDTTFFKGLLRETAKNFEISEVSADAGYMDVGNMLQVLMVGGKPYIAFRSNCTPDGEAKSTLWKRMLALFKERNAEFMQHYYRRNNVESTFSMVHRKFDKRLRGKTFRAQVNEALCKVLCHNICVLIQSMYELNIDPSFWTEPRPAKVEERLLSPALTNPEYILVQERLVPSRGNKCKAEEPQSMNKKGRTKPALHHEQRPLSLFDSLTPDTSEPKDSDACGSCSAESRGTHSSMHTDTEESENLPLLYATGPCQQQSLF